MGGKAFLKAAADLGAELPPGPRTHELDLLEALERWGSLIPVFRYREPDPVRVRRHVEMFPHLADPDLPIEVASMRLEVLLDLERRLSHWRHAKLVGSAPHPFDDLSPGVEEFLENPARVPLRPGTYRPVPVGRKVDGSPLLDDRRSFPVYRQWQVLHLAELLRSGVRLIHEPSESLVVDLEALCQPTEPDEPRRAFVWTAVPDVDGFGTHRSSLEATNWFEAYSQRALDLTEGERGPEGTTHISGTLYDELLREETHIARDALSRHGTSEDDVVAMLDWAARRARRHGQAGRLRMEAAYKDITLHAVRLLRSLGMEFDAIGDRMVGGRDLLDELFPDWLVEQRRRAHYNLVHVVLPRWVGKLEGVLDMPGEAECSAFLDWLEKGDGVQVFWHFEAFHLLYGRMDKQAVAALRREVSGMSAAFEHILNELGAIGDTLHPKLINLWRHQREVTTLIGTHGGLAKNASKGDLEAGLAVMRQTLQAPGAETVTRELLEAVAIRNVVQHRVLPSWDKRLLTEAFLTLLRASFLCWLLARSQSTVEQVDSLDGLDAEGPEDGSGAGEPGT